MPDNSKADHKQDITGKSREPLLFERRGRLGLVTLNRPQSLNALSLAMVQQMLAQLAAWRNDPAIEAIIVQGTGKAFCAGGDIKAAIGSLDQAERFFTAEYRLVKLIHNYPKPYISLIDGIVMGGGAGISINGSHRIVTERSLFAMPETAIGFYPDVGATWFLPRLPGEIGVYLALTGARLRAADLIYTGLATNYVPSADLETLLADLSQDDIETLLARYNGDPGEASLPALQPAIDRCFAFDRVEDILQALEAESSEWAGNTATTLARMAPTSLKLTLRQMRTGAALGEFADAIDLELALTRHMIQRPDFTEGVRAALVDRDKSPRWQPASFSDVDVAMIEKLLG